MDRRPDPFDPFSVLVSFGVGISSRSKDTILSFNMLFRVCLVLTSHFAEIFWWHSLLGYFFQAGHLLKVLSQGRQEEQW
ncbi:hypothetical protein GQ457_04G025070 [Hibiscus cannabinus]